MNALEKNYSDLAKQDKFNSGAMGTVYSHLPSPLPSASGQLGHA